MGFSESIEALKAVEGLDDHIGAILGHVESLKNESIGHRKKASDFEGKYNPLVRTLTEHGLNLETDLSEQIAGLKGKAGTTDEATRKIASVERQLAEMKAEKDALTIKAKRKTAEASFSSSLADNFYNGGVMLKALLSDGIIGVDEDDKPFVKIGDDTFDPVSGIAKLREHPDYKDGAKNRQNSGAGSSSHGGSNKKIITQDAFSKLSAREQAKWFADGNPAPIN